MYISIVYGEETSFIVTFYVKINLEVSLHGESIHSCIQFHCRSSYTFRSPIVYLPLLHNNHAVTKVNTRS